MRRRIGSLAVVVFGVGAAVSAPLIDALGPATRLAGRDVLWAIPLAAAPMLAFGLVYAFLGSAEPATGASYVWARRHVHPFAGFLVAWLRIATLVAALIVLAHALVQYLSLLAPVATPGPVVATALATVWALNTLGVSLAARAQTMLVAVLVVATGWLAVACFSAPAAAAGAASQASGGPGGVLAAAGVLAGLFFGVEAAMEAGAEIEAPARAPLALLVALALAVVLGLAIAAALLARLGPAGLAYAPAPLADAARSALGHAGAPVAAALAASGIAATMNTLFLVLSRTLMAMGETGVLPSALARVHSRRGAPWAATGAALGLCLAGLLLPAELVFLFVAISLANLVRYGVTALAALRALGRPDVAERSAVRLPRRWLAAIFWLALALAVGLAVAQAGADWRAYAALAAWSAIGAGYYLLRTAWTKSR